MTPLQEQRLIENFRKAYVDFPLGELIKTSPPLPDFMLKSKISDIGIELTEVFQSETLKQQSSFKNKITSAVISKLESIMPIMPFKFSLDVFPDRDVFISKSDIGKLSEQLVHICYGEFIGLSDNESIRLEHIELDLKDKRYESVKQEIIAKGYRNLPVGVKEIRMTRHDRISESYNSSSEGGAVPRMTLEHLSTILSKKERRLEKYRDQLAECWLVIQEGNYFTGSFSELELKFPLDTPFDKVFLYRLMHNDAVVILK